MSDELISVIVPVYNVEKYLNRCIESIINQTYKNLEIILVDDGSPDNCPAMCDEWGKKDNRIKVIHQKNAGAGAARNVGLDLANGDFIGVIDSDDYIDIHMYEHLIDLFEDDVDITECDYTYVNDTNFEFDFRLDFKKSKVSSQEAMKLNIQDKKFKQIAPIKLFRKSVLKDIRYPIGNLIDDEFFTYKAIGNSRNLVCSDLILYAYLQNEHSVMHEKFDLRRLEAIKAQVEKQHYLQEKFPDLLIENKIRIWSLGMYSCQMILKYGSHEDICKTFKYVKQIFRDIPLQINEIKMIKNSLKYFIVPAKYLLKLTCKIRNIIGIGL